ncbi:MAG: TonB-dependent receptor plug domain-containing protein [Desulfovibrio sp.]
MSLGIRTASIRRRKHGISLAAGLCALLLALPCMAAETKTLRSEQVVVTATRTEKELKETASSVDVITEEEIEKSGAATVADLLRDIPGVQVQDQSVAGIKRVVIRGESPSRVLVLVDGQKISEQKSMDGAALLMDVSSIERIEVIKGPASVLYGSEAIGGVINVITKKGGDKPIQAETAATFDSSTEGWTEHLSVFGNADGLNYRVSGSYTDANDRDTPAGELDDSSFLNRNFSVYLDKTFGSLTLGGRYEDFWSNENVPTAESDGAVVELDLPEWSRQKYAAFAEWGDIGENLSKARLDLYYQETYKNFFNYVDPPGPVSIDLHTQNWQDTYGGSLQTDWTLGQSHYLVAGVDVVADMLEAKARQVVTTPGPPFVTDTTYTNKAHQYTYAAYIQDEWNMVEDWVLTAGLRETIIQSELESSEDPDLEPGSSSGNRPVISLGLVYSGFEDWRLRAQYAQGYRFPSLQQMFIGTVHGSSTPTLGNPNLNPETSDNFEVGARYDNGVFALDTALFYNMADDYITTTTVNGGAAYQFVNVNTATTWGAELTGSYTLADLGLTPYLNATYLHREFETQTYTTSQTGDPAFIHRLGLRYETPLTEDLTFNADAYTRAASSAMERSGDETFTHNAWQTYNLNLGLAWGADRQYTLDVCLNNLTDEEYVEAAQTLVSPGFHTVIRLGVRF